MPSVLDNLLSANTTEEFQTAFRAWEKAHGSVFEWLADPSRGQRIAQLIPVDRCLDVLRAYQCSRQLYLAHVEDMVALGNFAQLDFNSHMLLMMLAEEQRGDPDDTRPILEQLLLTGDSEMRGVASEHFHRMGAACWDSFPVIVRVFAEAGVFELPFMLGKAVAQAIRAQPARLAELQKAWNQGNDLARQAICRVIEELGPTAAPLLDNLISMIEANSVESETISCAYLALGSMGVVNEQVKRLVRHAIGSDQWYIRGNAICYCRQFAPRS